MGKKVIVIGAGLGGICTALRLAVKGYDVHVLEKYHQAGGRLNQFESKGFTFDMGPSFFSMSYEFEELFTSCGIVNPLKFKPLEPLYAVNFAGNDKPYLVSKNLSKLAEQFGNAEPDFVNQAQKYLKQAGAVFHDTEYKIVKRDFNGLGSYLAAMATVPLKHLPLLFRSMWANLGIYFESEEAKIIFSLVAFFLGATPFDTPAVYSLLNYTELVHDGYWNVEGGMYRITQALLELAEQRGVKFKYNTEIAAIQQNNGRMVSCTDIEGNLYQADIFICNADAAAFRGKILKRKKYSPQKLDKMEWTLAPFTIYLGVQGKIPALHHHNYFLGNNFKEYAGSIFKSSIAPEKPYYYVNVSSKSNPACAPEGCENLFILCPVPDLRFKAEWSDSEALADNIIADLSARTGFNLKAATITRTVYNPTHWQEMFGLYRGSGLGLAHGLNQVGGLRPSNTDEELDNLYYVGASTVPGTGLPIVVISSRLAAEKVLKQHPLYTQS